MATGVASIRFFRVRAESVSAPAWLRKRRNLDWVCSGIILKGETGDRLVFMRDPVNTLKRRNTSRMKLPRNEQSLTRSLWAE
jgi:hypothetical protein